MKTLIIDIETSPMLGYFWRLGKAHMGIDNVLEHSKLLTVGYRWSDDVYTTVHHEHRRYVHSYEDLLWLVKYKLDEADVVVAHNGAKFDIPYLNAQFAKYNIPPPKPFILVDTLLIARKNFELGGNSLANLAKFLGVEVQKKDHAKFAGMSLWKEFMAGNPEAVQEMTEYNRADVDCLHQVYEKLKPFAHNLPPVANIDGLQGLVCPFCGSHKVQQRGYRFTKVGKYSRYFCTSCTKWSTSRKNINARGAIELV